MNTKFWANIGRISLILSALSLIGTWIAVRSGTFLGFNETHLFNDAIVFGLLGIGILIDALLHSKKI